MSTDLYQVTVDFVGAPSERLEDMPWFTAGVRRLAALAKLTGAGDRTPEDLFNELSQRMAAASPGAAARLVPVDKSIQKTASEIIKLALLHRHHPEKYPPRRHLGIFTVSVLEPGSNIPSKNYDRIWFARFLWEADSEHPLRKEYSFEKLHAKNFYLPSKFGVEMSFVSRAKSGAPLYVMAPPEWFTPLSVGESYRTTAYA